MKLSKQVLILLLCCLLVRFTAQAESFGPTDQSNEQSPTPPAQYSPQELQQLVAPIALYPDALVAQVLAASTYPNEIVEADRWMQSHSNLKGEELAKEVDKQPWDPSVKALTQFPSVLENMDKNLSWTSSLGDAYANQQEAVTDAVQAMRQQARKAGHLNSNEQEKVTAQGNTIIIEPANPEVVYVPAYDPWLVYGEPIVAYPGWYPVPGIFLAGAGIGFGIGFGLQPQHLHLSQPNDHQSQQLQPRQLQSWQRVPRKQTWRRRSGVPWVFGSSLSAWNTLRGVQWLRSRRKRSRLFLPRAVKLWRWLPWRRFSWRRWWTT